MDKVKVELSRNEALVLVDFLLRFRDNELLAVEDESEVQVLYDLCAMVESEVPELLDEKYVDLLWNARDAIKRNNGIES